MISPSLLRILAATLLCIPALNGAPGSRIAMPDFTKGDAIPKGAVHDWNLGATGCRGWMFSDKLVTTDARQVFITRVDKGSPADGVLEIGDVILGVGGKAFAHDPRTEIGRALTEAEQEKNNGILELIRWRGGKTGKVTLKLPVLGSYSLTAPYDCQKSQRILIEGCRALAARMSDANYRPNPIPRSLNALALLASGNPDYLPLVKKEAQWAAGFSADGFQTWYYGYVMMFLAEYTMATGDDSGTAGLRRLALEASNGQSIVGSWGHRFAGEDGRLMGYGMMNSPGIPLTTALVMARAAGIKDPAIDRAIERSARLLRFYIGKGAVPYGDHRPWTQTHEDNGKCGMASVLFNLLNESEGARFFSRMSLASHGAERDCGHTGNFFNVLWSLPAVAQTGPVASGLWMQEFGGWYFDLARRPDGSFVHLGPPGTRHDKYARWDCTGAYLLSYALPLKKIYLTGKRKGAIPQLDAAAAAAIIRDGRGWSNKERNSAYDKLDTAQLIERLGNWSPIVRERAAMALARGKTVPTAELVKMLGNASPEARYGACQALAMLKGKAAEAVPALTRCLQHEDMWLRIEAAEALANIGKPAMPALPALLRILARQPTKADPRGMEQRYLSFAVFGTMLRNSLDGVDRNQLRTAIEAGLRNQDGRARGTVGRVYNQLSYEEIKPLLPAIHQAIVKPAPSGIMFASGIRLSGVELLAKHRIREGMDLCFQILDIEKWGKQDRIRRSLRALSQYGGAAKAVLPQLRQLEKDLKAHREARNLKPIVEQIGQMMKKIEASTEKVEL
ncbi:MAG: DUF6288 domain-containing protein, partial [Verrucomicrobiales bacterium]|nr:DUF6288 domain-containing protein [Verrucomicrobiales bacterium]